MEDNESPYQALLRERHEELGISIHKTTLLTHISQDYAHARVWLDVYVIESYSSEVSARENQQVVWLDREEISRKEVLPPLFIPFSTHWRSAEIFEVPVVQGRYPGFQVDVIGILCVFFKRGVYVSSRPRPSVALRAGTGVINYR